MRDPYIELTDIERAGHALDWLIKAYQATGQRGFAHSYSRLYHPLNGWHKAYPETTGYIIETLLDYDPLFPQKKLKDIAIQASFWLTEIQLPDGSFNSGVVGGTRPSVFNTGMILFGLVRAYKACGDTTLLTSIRKALDWLKNQLGEDGSWQAAAYVDGYIPVYYTRAVWGALEASRVLKTEMDKLVWTKALDYYAGMKNANSTFQNLGFFPGKPAYTHTIAYTIRGFIESGLLLGDERYVDLAEETLDKMILIIGKKGKMAGSYDQQWKGDYSYKCITGQAQISICLNRLAEIRNRQDYRQMAEFLMVDVKKRQRINVADANIKGALPGSSPVWGPYMRFRYPNWAAKFFLDALLFKITSEEKSVK